MSMKMVWEEEETKKPRQLITDLREAFIKNKDTLLNEQETRLKASGTSSQQKIAPPTTILAAEKNLLNQHVSKFDKIANALKSDVLLEGLADLKIIAIKLQVEKYCKEQLDQINDKIKWIEGNITEESLKKDALDICKKDKEALQKHQAAVIEIIQYYAMVARMLQPEFAIRLNKTGKILPEILNLPLQEFRNLAPTLYKDIAVEVKLSWFHGSIELKSNEKGMTISFDLSNSEQLALAVEYWRDRNSLNPTKGSSSQTDDAPPITTIPMTLGPCSDEIQRKMQKNLAEQRLLEYSKQGIYFEIFLHGKSKIPLVVDPNVQEQCMKNLHIFQKQEQQKANVEKKGLGLEK